MGKLLVNPLMPPPEVECGECGETFVPKDDIGWEWVDNPYEQGDGFFCCAKCLEKDD